MAATVRKVSLAIGRDALAWAEKRARVEKTSVSAVLTLAARREQAREAAEARRDAAWAKYVRWATKGKGLDAADLEAGQRILDDLDP